MNEEVVIERLFPMLISGDRTASREIVQEAVADGMSPETLAHDVFWPILETVDKLFRSDKLTMLAHHYATRLLRSLIDQVQPAYNRQPTKGRSILLFSGPTEQDELRGLLMADLAEANGFEIKFGGGGIANDEILAEIGEQRPDVLMLFASGAQDAPNIRMLVDTIRGVDAVPDLQVVVGGGVFNRAEGLAEEIGADLWAKSPREMLDRMVEEPNRRATEEQRTVGRTRRPTRKVA